MKRVHQLAVLLLLCITLHSTAGDSDLAKNTTELVQAAKKGNADPAALKSLLSKIIDALAAGELETNEAARKDPQTCLDKLEFLVSRPGGDAERTAYCAQIAERLMGTLHVPAKIWLLKSLERIGSAESVATEVKLLSDPDETVRETARRALAANPADEASVELRKALDAAADAKARTALIEALGFKRNKMDVQLFEKEAENADAGVKAAALAALAAQGVRKESGVMEQVAALIDTARAANAADIPKLLAALDAPNIKIRQTAVQAVNLNASPEMTQALVEKMKAAAPDAKPALLGLLAQRGDKAALPAILEQAASDDQNVRVAAIQAVGFVGGGAAVAPLMHLAVSGKGFDQHFARESLDRMKGEDVDRALSHNLMDNNVDVLKEVAQRLAARNTVSVPGGLTYILGNKDKSVRLESLKALAAVGGKDTLPQVLKVLCATEFDDERDQAAKTIVAISRRLPETDGHADMVVEALKDAKSEPARAALLSALGQIGGPKALETVRAAMSDDSTKIQEVAFRALAGWPDAAPMDELLKLAQSAENETHRVLALRGFVRMAGLPGTRSSKDTLALFAGAQAAIKTADDRKLILSALSEIKDPGAVDACAELIADPAVSEEACMATVKAAKNFENAHKESVATAMKTVIEHTKNKQTKEQAQAILNKQAKN